MREIIYIMTADHILQITSFWHIKLQITSLETLCIIHHKFLANQQLLCSINGYKQYSTGVDSYVYCDYIII